MTVCVLVFICFGFFQHFTLVSQNTIRNFIELIEVVNQLRLPVDFLSSYLIAILIALLP